MVGILLLMALIPDTKKARNLRDCLGKTLQSRFVKRSEAEGPGNGMVRRSCRKRQDEG